MLYDIITSKRKNARRDASAQREAAEEVIRCETSLEGLLKLSEEGGPEAEEEADEYGPVLLSLQEDVCRKCPRYRFCFGERAEETREAVARLFALAGENAGVEREMLDGPFWKKCVFLREMTDELRWLYGIHSRNRYWERCLRAQRRLTLLAMQSQIAALRQCRRRLLTRQPMPPGLKRRLGARLRREGIRLLDAFSSGKGEEEEYLLTLAAFAGPGRISCVEECLSEAVGHRCRLRGTERWLKRGANTLAFIREGNFHVLFGCRHSSKCGENVCGDAFSFLDSGNGKAVLLLSDGMGSGADAYADSSRLIEAFEGVLEAGIAEEDAMEMLHGAAALRQNRAYATLDVSVISLFTGMVKVMKAGGAATFIKRKDSVERIAPAGLPPGALPAPQVEVARRKLYDGDMVVMVSDGVLAFEQSGELPLSMEEILSGIPVKNARLFADQVMERIPETEGACRDDRTVLVASVWEKGQRNVENDRSLRTKT